MRRSKHFAVAGIATVLLVSGCAVVREGGPEFGPEQFQFVIEPGFGEGPEAEDIVSRLLTDVGESYEPGTAEHLGFTTTPAGRLDIIAFEQENQRGDRSRCQGRFSAFAGGWGCGPVDQDPGLVPAGRDLLVGGGGGSDEWSEADLYVSDRVVRLRAVAQDGAIYDLRPGSGYAFVMWPSRRGPLSITALAADGSVLGTGRAEAASTGAGPLP